MEEIHNRYFLRLPSTVVSFLGGIVVLISVYKLNQKKRKLSKYLQDPEMFVDPLFEKIPLSFLVSLIVADVISNVGWLIPYPTLHHTACVIQAVLIQFGQLASTFWTTCFALVMLKAVFEPSEDQTLGAYHSISFKWLCHLVSWGIPAMNVSFLVIFGHFGPTSEWCWISPGIGRWTSFYLLLWFCILVILVTASKCYRSKSYSSTDHKYIILLPLLWAVIWIPASLSRIAEEMGYRILPLMFLQEVVEPLQGLINALLYGISLHRMSKEKMDLYRQLEILEKKSSWKDNAIISSLFIVVVGLRGSLQLILHYGGSVAPPFTLVFFSRIIGTFGSLIIVSLEWIYDWNNFRIRLKSVLTKRHLAKTCLMGAVNMVIPVILYSYAQDLGKVQSGVGTVMTSTIPIIVILFSRYFLKQNDISRPVVIGIATGFAGVLLVCISASASQKNNVENSNVVFYLVFYCGVIFQAAALVYWKKYNVPSPNNVSSPSNVPSPNNLSLNYTEDQPLLRNSGIGNHNAIIKDLGKVDPELGMFAQNVVGIIIGLIGMILIDFNLNQGSYPRHFAYFPQLITEKGIFVVLWLGLASAIIASTAYFNLMNKAGPLITGSTYYGQPIVAQVEAVIFLNIWADVPIHWILIESFGGVLVIVGLVLCTIFNKTPEKKIST